MSPRASSTIKYDVSDVPETGGGEAPQPATYKGKIVQVTNRKQRADGSATNDLEVVVDVGANYVRLWTYIPLDPAASNRWKLREFTDAIGLPAKGSIDPKKIEGKPVIVKVRAGKDLDGNYRGEVKNLFKPGTVEPDEDEETVAETDGNLSEWSDEDLKAELAERGLKVAGRWTRDKAIEALEPEVEAEDEEPEEEEAEAELPAGYEDIDDWDSDDLKAEVKELGIEISGRFSAQKARDAIIEHLTEPEDEVAEEEEEEEASDEPTDDYDSWDDQDLKDEIQSRNEQGAEIKVAGRWSRKKGVEALREDDKAAEPF